MKKLSLLFLIATAATSCVITEPTIRNWGMDYHPYMEYGFYVSPLSEVGEEKFTPIATIGTVYKYTYEEDIKSYADLLYALIPDALAIGANGLIGLKTESRTAESRSTISLEGVAVKFEGRPSPDINGILELNLKALELYTSIENSREKKREIKESNNQETKYVNNTSLDERIKEAIKNGSKYDYTGAINSIKSYIKKKKGEIFYLYPETNSYISKKEFLNKYTENDLLILEDLHRGRYNK